MVPSALWWLNLWVPGSICWSFQGLPGRWRKGLEGVRRLGIGGTWLWGQACYPDWCGHCWLKSSQPADAREIRRFCLESGCEGAIRVGVCSSPLICQARNWTRLQAMPLWVQVITRLQDGYDHSYFFIATFVDDHVQHAANALKDWLPCEYGYP